jgi:dTDP-4-dehydrorhamnose reductase
MGVRVLIAGGGGQLATALRQVAWPGGWDIVHAGRPALDLADPERAACFVRAAAPDLLINAAAFTAVDRAEDEPALAMRINAEAPAAMAEALRPNGGRFVFLSSDYVFDGTKPAPYLESDTTAPLSAYGLSKQAGEAAVLAADPGHLVVRTSWVFSPWGTNFVKTMLRLGAERDEVRVVADQQGCPAFAPDLAVALAGLSTAAAAGDLSGGIYHAANAGEVSWHGFAAAIYASAARRGARVPRLVAIPAAEFGAKARRPANGVLGGRRLMAETGIAMRPWSAALDDCLDALIGPGG